MSEKMIDPNDAVDFMIAQSAKYAEAEANKVYMEEMRKTIKAEEMKVAERLGNGEYKTAAMQEREAYASPRYKQHLEALKQAVEERERLRWLLIAAQERIAVWRSMEASNRHVEKATL
jgi:glutathionyl-hydroquinone reductase